MVANEPKLPSGQIVKWQERDYPTVYSNLMGFSMTGYDISLLFGQVGEATAKEVKGIPQVKVLLSPEQVSNLIQLLGVSLKTYIERFGDIRTSNAVNIDEVYRQMEENKFGLAVEDES